MYKIKSLEWTEYNGIHSAKTPFGNYIIREIIPKQKYPGVSNNVWTIERITLHREDPVLAVSLLSAKTYVEKVWIYLMKKALEVI